MATIDVTVRGGGVFGLTVAFTCQLRGARVRLVETRAVGAGSSGGILGAMAPHTPDRWNPKKQFQLESLLMAGAFWRRVEELSGRAAGYLRSGRLQSVASDRALALAIARFDDAQTNWGDRASWSVIPGAQAGEWAPRSASGYLVHDTLAARIHPRAATKALAAAFQALGGEITTEAPAGEGVEVLATGYEGLRTLSECFGKRVGAAVKGQAALLRFEASARPQLFIEGLHIVPHHDGTVAVGSTSECDFDAPDAVDGRLDVVLDHVRAAVPILAEAPVVERWAGVRARARSRAPMLGALPGRPDVFIANGAFKIGFGMAPKVGEVMADLLLEGRDEIPDVFRVEASL
ncbi:MAG: FAD-dependent oxidoreductase [Pseudomonadota bacterium]